MSLTRGQLMTQYQNTRKELGTITYSRLVKPNILDDYTLYLKDLTEMEELDRAKDDLVIDKQPKNIDLTKKNTIFDLLEMKDKKPVKSEEKQDEKQKEKQKEKQEEKEKEKQDEKQDEKQKEKQEENSSKSDDSEDKKGGKKNELEDNSDNDKTGGKKLLKITVSTEPDAKSNKLML